MTRKHTEEHNQSQDAGRVGRFRVEVFLHEVPECAHDKHDINQRRNQRQDDLKNHDVRQSDPTEHTFAGKRSAMLPH